MTASLSKTSSNIKFRLVQLIPKISAQYLLLGPSKSFLSVGLGSKWLSPKRVESSSRIVDYNAPPNSCTLAKLSQSWGYDNQFISWTNGNIENISERLCPWLWFGTRFRSKSCWAGWVGRKLNILHVQVQAVADDFLILMCYQCLYNFRFDFSQYYCWCSLLNSSVYVFSMSILCWFYLLTYIFEVFNDRIFV